MNTTLDTFVTMLEYREKARASSQRFGIEGIYDEQIELIERTSQKVSSELLDAGLFADGTYLDSFSVELMPVFCGGQGVYVHDEILGYVRKPHRIKEGVIYIPSDLIDDTQYFKGALLNSIRNAYGYAWGILDPEFFAEPWFVEGFGLTYFELDPIPRKLWRDGLSTNVSYQQQLEQCRSKRERRCLEQRQFRNDFATDTAARHVQEDFAETFTTYLRFRNSLERFKPRTGVWRKLMVVKDAVKLAAERLAK